MSHIKEIKPATTHALTTKERNALIQHSLLERRKEKEKKQKAKINPTQEHLSRQKWTVQDRRPEQQQRWGKLPKKTPEEEEKEAIFWDAIRQPGSGNMAKKVTNFQRKKEDATLARIRNRAEELREKKEAAAAAVPVANAPPASKEEGKKKPPGFLARIFGKVGGKRGRKRITRKKRGGRKRKNKTKTKRKTLRKSHKKRRKMARRKKTKRRR